MKGVAIGLSLFLAAVCSAPATWARDLRLAAPMVFDQSTRALIDRFASAKELPEADLKIAVVEGLGAPTAVLGMLRERKVDLALLPGSIFETAFPQGSPVPHLSLMMKALTTANPAENFAVQDSVYGDMMTAELGKRGFIALGYWSRLSVPLITTRALRTQDDLKGLKVATGDQGSRQVIAGLGGSAVLMGGGEVQMAIVRGEVEGAVLPIDPDRDSLAPYNGGTLVADYRQPLGFLVALQDLWIDLTEDQRNALATAAKAAQATGRATVLAAYERLPGLAQSANVRFATFSELGRSFVAEKAPAIWLEGLAARGEPALELLKRVKLDMQSPQRRQGGGLSPGIVPPVYFATLRKDEKNKSLVKRFGLRPGPTDQAIVTCGRVSYAVEPERELGGSIRGPIDLAPDPGIVTDRGCITPLAQAASRANGELIIFIHGFRNSMETALRFGIGVASDLATSSPLLVWSWPSGGRIEMYRYDEESTEFSRPYFQDMLKDLLNHAAIKRVVIISHSMGGRLAIGGLEALPQSSAKLKNMIWVAPDVAVSIFADRIGKHATKAAATTLYAAMRDWALLISANWHDEARAGLAGESLVIVKGLDSIDATPVEAIVGVNHSHAFDIPEAARDLRSLVVQGLSTEQRGLKKAWKGESLYWRIEPTQ
jgi:TRAP-type C4-dicarboxylate transport system substrate-binding protein/pimeloyl-ACP methyl ester carboxylesterase